MFLPALKLEFLRGILWSSEDRMCGLTTGIMRCIETVCMHNNPITHYNYAYTS